MALNILRRGGRTRPVAPPPLAIGEPDSEIFGCPACSRPLAVGARRCQGCGTRLVMGVPLAKASVFAGVGLAAGIAVASLVTAGFVAFARPAAGGLVAGDGPVPSASAGSVVTTQTPHPTPRPTDGGPPALTRAALGQAVDLNARLAERGVALAGLVGAGDLDAYAVAAELRSLASAAAQGTALAPRIVGWAPAASLAEELEAFYGGVRQTARNGLQSSMTNDEAYRAAAHAMLGQLAGLPDLDARTLEAAREAGAVTR